MILPVRDGFIIIHVGRLGGGGGDFWRPLNVVVYLHHILLYLIIYVYCVAEVSVLFRQIFAVINSQLGGDGLYVNQRYFVEFRLKIQLPMTRVLHGTRPGVNEVYILLCFPLNN